MGPSASQVGAASSLQDLAQALLKVLAPTQPESTPASEAPVPTPSATAADPPATAPTEETRSAAATPLPPTQLEGMSPPPVEPAPSSTAPADAGAPEAGAPTAVEPGQAPSDVGAEVAEAETQPGELPERTLTKQDMKNLSEGVLDCDMFFLFLRSLCSHLR